ncbi:unnamed protein product [Symbiodinium natans]|uniref:RRM domain-containing protein n=1 Tax=Symbiodinium natans TaxID=878477 RepID=A0A812UT79_9DINO|nr:unnamed protein product [Symbiodinium natans]
MAFVTYWPPFRWRSMGRACVQFKTREAAVAAVQTLDGSMLDGRAVRLEEWTNKRWPSSAATCVFVRNLSWRTRGWKLKAHMQAAGEVTWAHVLTLDGMGEAAQKFIDRSKAPDTALASSHPRAAATSQPTSSCELSRNASNTSRGHVPAKFLSLPLVLLDNVMGFLRDFAICVTLCRNAAASAAEYATCKVHAQKKEAFQRCFWIRSGNPQALGHRDDQAARCLLACLGFACTFARVRPKALVALVEDLLHSFRHDEGAVRVGAASFLKELVARRTPLQRLIAKHMVAFLAEAQCMPSERARACAILACCGPDLGRFGRPCVSALIKAVCRQEKGAFEALDSMRSQYPQYPVAEALQAKTPTGQSSIAIWIDWGRVQSALVAPGRVQRSGPKGSKPGR